MTTRDTSSWLPNLLGPLDLQADGVAVDVPRRSTINLIAATIADDPDNERTDISIGAAPSTLVGNGSGVATISATKTTWTGNAKRIGTEYQISALGVAATALLILTIPTVVNRTYSIRGIVSIQNSPVSAYGEWDIKAFARNATAGGLSIVTASPITENANVSSFVVALSVNANSLELKLTDPSGGRRITGTVYVAEAIF